MGQKTRDAWVQFRGREEHVEYHDHGDDEETNSHYIDWWFTGEGMRDLEISPDEEYGVYNQICTIVLDRYSNPED